MSAQCHFENADNMILLLVTCVQRHEAIGYNLLGFVCAAPLIQLAEWDFSSIYLAWNRINLHVSHIFIIPVNWNFGPVWFFFLPIALFCIVWKRPELRNKRRVHAEKNVRGFMQQSRNNAFSLNYILFTVCVCVHHFLVLCDLWVWSFMMEIQHDHRCWISFVKLLEKLNVRCKLKFQVIQN